MHDVAVVGLGPAGRSLAHRCAARGLSVLAVDPAPDRTWRPTYGVWLDEVVDVLPPTTFRAVVDGPAIAAPWPRRLERTYVVLDNAAVQAHLSLDRVDVDRRALDDAGVAALTTRARVVVDARGARPGTPAGALTVEDLGDVPAQTAYGVILSARDAAPALRGRPALLMDFGLDWADGDIDPRDVATFLYAIPLGGGRVLLEETALAAHPAPAPAVLRERLHRRLRRRGVPESALADPLETEEVVIPVLGRGREAVAGTVALGTAGAGSNPVTGYSVAYSLRRADATAAAIAEGATTADLGRRMASSRRSELLRRAGLRALLRLDVEGTLGLFDAFGRVPARSQRAFLDRGCGAAPLLEAMARMWVHMSPRNMGELVRATLGPQRG